jgi:hypothetical protein
VRRPIAPRGPAFAPKTQPNVFPQFPATVAFSQPLRVPGCVCPRTSCPRALPQPDNLSVSVTPLFFPLFPIFCRGSRSAAQDRREGCRQGKHAAHTGPRPDQTPHQRVSRSHSRLEKAQCCGGLICADIRARRGRTAESGSRKRAGKQSLVNCTACLVVTGKGAGSDREFSLCNSGGAFLNGGTSSFCVGSSNINLREA